MINNSTLDASVLTFFQKENKTQWKALNLFIKRMEFDLRIEQSQFIAVYVNRNCNVLCL